LPRRNSSCNRNDAYKNAHRDHYLKDIHKDIVYLKKTYSQIEHKFFMDNRSVDQVVDGLMEMLNIIGK